MFYESFFVQEFVTNKIIIHTKAKNDILSFNYGYFCYNTDKITVFCLKGNSRFKLQKRPIQEQKVLPTF